MMIVQAEKLEKKFGTFSAVDKISFEVEEGHIFGFIGANGAGKSTTIRMLCGLLLPTSGQAQVAGYNINKDSEKIKKVIGYMSQKFSLYDILSVKENLIFYGGLYSLRPEYIKRRARELTRKLDLEGRENTIIKILPPGIKQRVALACALIHEPKILFLDEPTAGVDPILRQKFWKVIDDLAYQGTTVFVTTHYMDEIEHCQEAALMAQGRIIKQGMIHEIKSSTFSSAIREIETDDPVKGFQLLKKNEGLGYKVSVHGTKLHINIFKKALSLERGILPLLKKNHIHYTPPLKIEASMEDVFVELVSRWEKNEN